MYEASSIRMPTDFIIRLKEFFVKRFAISVMILLALAAVPLFSNDSLEQALPGLGQEDIARLRSGELVSQYSFRADISTMAGEGTIAHDNLERSLSIPDSFTVLSLSFTEYPSYMKQMSQEERQLAIYNTIRSISTQEGIQYISYRAGNKPRTLIEKSWYVASRDTKKEKLPDPVSDHVDAESTYIAYQKDSRFGGNVYQHQYTTSDSEIFLSVKNIDTMKVAGIFVAVDEEMLEISMSVSQLDEGLLLTAMATIIGMKPEINILGIKVDLPSSFTRRTTALGNWFKDRISQTE